MSDKKVVVITGGSRGIGAATAKLFARNGFSVCINYKSNVDAAKALVEEIKALGGHCISVQADVSKEGDVVKLFETIDQELGVVSVLVNNA
ncbi:SDR family NAD(P)-dependent oxidoreductase, partial [Vibrio metschnikovii]|nr:SDR family NAD(P)-dependent oxidoreductase [Vibrio metschnikovii]EKO3781861.1 SDR family NAD(P)-dependent oxidoreductase [Vibrio metschnikovii]EKO3781916.1 SDR family NAD(P)-dependent oxidoreductase [Vibrio metschnikovii]EKO3888746.1 SDR family NAD(P)-dependent oxidoreductase [Vibrio metschnikovii]